MHSDSFILVGDRLLLKGLQVTWDIYDVCRYNRCHVNAVKGFWALWDNIYDCVEAYLLLWILSTFLAGNFLVTCVKVTVFADIIAESSVLCVTL
jgi:hypothetical protein